MSTDATIQKIIADFQPPRLPLERELDEIVVVVDPRGGGSGSAAQREQDDLALTAGAWLFHLIQRAGGTPIMTRVDDRAVPVTSDGDRERSVSAFGERYLGDLTVSIAGDEGGGAEVRLATGECVGRIENGEAGARTRRHVRLAERLYGVLATFVSAEPGRIDSARGELFAGRDRGEIRPIPYFTLTGWEADVRHAARRLWPTGDLPIERAEWFCRLFRQAVPHNLTAVYFEPRVEARGDKVWIGGATNVVQMRDTLVHVLEAVGLKAVTNEMRLLPEEGRLGSAHYGICAASMSMTFAEPDEGGDAQTQLLYGQPVLLLDRDAEAGYLLVQGPDGYWGWTREECIETRSAEEYRDIVDSPRAVIQRDLELGGRRVVRGAQAPVSVMSELSAESVHVFDGREANAALALKALEWLDLPYVFGGVSPLGVDCSGFVQNLCGQVGVATARNASQQFLHGRLVGTRWQREGVRAGDLLFFIDGCGKIYHVGVALSATHYVHSAPPGVQINSLEEGDRLYNEARARAFFAAKRMF